MHIVPIAFAFDHPWRFSSWDRLAMPRPFSRAVCYGGAPIVVPAGCKAAELAHYQKVAGEAMHQATARAEHLLAQLPQNAKLRRWGPGKQMPEMPTDRSENISKAA